MTYTIEKLKEQWTSTSDPVGIFDYYRIIPELIAEVERLTRQIRAEEITGLNMRLRTARECAEMCEQEEVLLATKDCETPLDCSTATAIELGSMIRAKFEVPA